MYLTGIPLPTLLAFLLLGSLLSLPFLGVTAKIVTFHVERHHRDLEHRKIYAVSLSVITVGFWLFLFVTQREVFPYMAISVAISYFTLIGEAFLIAPTVRVPDTPGKPYV
jgi:hypothetical protein